MSRDVTAAPRSIDRRAFLAGGAAAAMPGVLPLSEPALSALIATHAAAFRAFEKICSVESDLEESDPGFLEIRAEYRRLSDAEENALTALCQFRPSTMEEVQRRGDYLAEFLLESEMTPEQATALMASFRSRLESSGLANTLRAETARTCSGGGHA